MRVPKARLSNMLAKMLVTLAALASLAGAQSAPDWRFADPGAQIVGGLDVHGLLTSPLVTAGLSQATGKMGDAAPMMQMVLGTLNGVSQVYFSVTTRNQDAEALLMIKGRLEDATAKMLMQGAGASNPQAKSTMDIVRIDADTILMGSPALLTAAQHRLERASAVLASPLLARAASISAGNDFWIGGSLPDIPAVSLIAAGIKGFSLGVGLQNDLSLHVSLNMTTAAMAQQMAAQLQQAVEQARKNQPDVNAKMETKVEGSTLYISSMVPHDEVLKAFEERMKNGLPSGGTGFGSPAAAPKPAPKESQDVRIYGLDEGTKVVPVPKNQH